MNYRLVFRMLGRILLLEAAAMLPSLIVSLVYSDGAALSFVIAIAATAAPGAALNSLLGRNEKTMRPKDGFVAVALCWIAISIFGALPMFISGVIPSYTDALFEAVSGFTTTSATVLPYVEGLPESIIFWRAFMHWIGGMGILVLTLAIIPAGERGAHNLVRAETTGPFLERIVPRLRKMTTILYIIYIVLSLTQTVFLLFGGMNFYDSLIHMFGTVGTGGCSSRNLSVGSYNSAYIDYVIGIFMFLSSVNFGLYYAIISRKLIQVYKNTELRVFIGIIAVSTVFITVNLLMSGTYATLPQAVRYSFFQVSSMASSTGYVTTDFNLWPEASRAALLIIMAVGACASSTGGGLKVVRVVMLFKSAVREMKKILHPRSVNAVHTNGQPVPDKTLTGVMHYFAIYIFIMLLAMLLVSFDNFGFDTTFSGVLSTISNTGPGMGIIGPGADYSEFSLFSKLVLSICMLVGRLEIFPILILLAPSSWKKS